MERASSRTPTLARLRSAPRCIRQAHEKCTLVRERRCISRAPATPGRNLLAPGKQTSCRSASCRGGHPSRATGRGPASAR
ncbi:hypothetical protein ACFPRL_24375 [Pseudoclavibacter helvolus]